MKKINLLIFVALIAITGCKKKATNTAGVDPRVPPNMTLKTGGKYTSADKTVNKQDTILIGIVCTKTEDNLTTINGSYSFDGASTTNSFYNHQCLSTEYTGFSVDVNYYVRNQTGTEKLTLSVVDRDGNITKKIITLTVQ